MLRYALLPLAAAGLLTAAENRKPMRLAAEILSYALEDPQHEPFVQTLENAVGEYGIGELMVHGFSMDRWLPYSAYPKVQRQVDPARLAAYRKQLQRFKRRGVKITLSGGGPVVPSGFFEAYPEARRISNGQFRRYIEASTAEVFHQVPEADCLEIYLWETPLLNDVVFFPGMHWAESAAESNLTADQYFSPADFITELLAGYAQGARNAGRQFLFLTFSHYPWQEKLLIEALRKLDRSLPVLLDHKVQPGDWSPYRPANNVMLKVTDREAMLLYDGTGEYWGQSLVPYCYPDEIQQRLRHALAHNPSINALGMRVNWVAGHTLFGNFNEVNFYALSRLAKDPLTPIEDIWRGWAEKRFGAAAAPRVISALRRSNEIGNLVYYIRGVWVHNHSAISGLPYLESHVVHYARSSAEWNPADFRNVFLLDELANAPREHTIDWVLADREEALRLNALSLADVEAARASLPPAEYRKLREQFTLQRRFIEVSIPHIEAFLRYRIEKRAPSAGNRGRLAQTLRLLDKQAQQVESEYREQVPILTAAGIRRYVQELRAAVPGL